MLPLEGADALLDEVDDLPVEGASLILRNVDQLLVSRPDWASVLRPLRSVSTATSPSSNAAALASRNAWS